MKADEYIVNCVSYDAGKCVAGHYGGSPPLVACGICQHRQAVHADRRAVYAKLTVKATKTCPSCSRAAKKEANNGEG